MIRREKNSANARTVCRKESCDHSVQYWVYEQSQVEDKTGVIEDFVHRVMHDNHDNLRKRDDRQIENDR